MDQVVAAQDRPWLETPDQAVVWGVALGLHEEVEDVLERSRSRTCSAAARRVDAVLPDLVLGRVRRLGRVAAPAGRRLRSGLFSSSVVPDFGGMMSALGTIGNSPVLVGHRAAAAASRAAAAGGGGGGAGGGF